MSNKRPQDYLQIGSMIVAVSFLAATLQGSSTMPTYIYGSASALFPPELWAAWPLAAGSIYFTGRWIGNSFIQFLGTLALLSNMGSIAWFSLGTAGFNPISLWASMVCGFLLCFLASQIMEWQYG